MKTNKSNIIRSVDLGNDAAETDRILNSAFIETRQFREAHDGYRRLILGRKGTGKTAIFKTLSDRLNTSDQTVVQVTPSRIFWGSIAKKNENKSSEELTNLWEFSIYCRIFLDARLEGTIDNPSSLQEIEELLKSILGRKRIRGTKIQEHVNENVFNKIWESVATIFTQNVSGAEVDFTFFKIKVDLNNTEGIVPDEIVSEFRYRLNKLVPSGHRIRVLFDQLDEYWDGKSNSQKMMTSMLSAILNINEAFPDRVIPTIFLRTDIWELLHFVRKDRFPQYETTITWKDDELVTLICERIRKSGNINGSDKEVWKQVFGEDSTPANRTSPGYMLNRTFKRPRDMLYFTRECLAETRLTDDNKISPNVVSYVEKELNSKTLTENLINEVTVNYPFVRALLLEFRGKSFRLTRSALAIIFRDARKHFDGTISRKYNNLWLEEWLFEICVLGVSNDKSANNKKILYQYSSQSSIDVKRYKYFYVHPGLRPRLGSTSR